MQYYRKLPLVVYFLKGFTGILFFYHKMTIVDKF